MRKIKIFEPIGNHISNPYTSRLLMRISAIKYRLKGLDVYLSKNGYICFKSGVSFCEIRPIFGSKFFFVAADIQNLSIRHRIKFIRKILSY